MHIVCHAPIPVYTQNQAYPQQSPVATCRLPVHSVQILTATGKSGARLGYENLYVDGAYQRDLTVLDTLSLNKGQVTIIVGNHLPEGTSFPASYRLLVEKGDAAN